MQRVLRTTRSSTWVATVVWMMPRALGLVEMIALPVAGILRLAAPNVAAPVMLYHCSAKAPVTPLKSQAPAVPVHS